MPVMRVPIAAGRGMDRATGTVAQSPGVPVDARNIYGREDKVALRPGMTGTGFPSLVWGTDIIGSFPLRATLDEILVVYDRPSREIRVFRLDTVNGILQTLTSPPYGLWGTLNAQAEFPVVVAAESAGMLFLAHCEPVLDNRLATVYYTPDDAIPGNVGTLTTYTAALSVSLVVGPCYFSFVFAYLEYLCGAGYGSDLDPDRGDIVHMAQPTAPLDMRPPNYAIFGTKKDPIIALGTTNAPTPIGVAGTPAAGQSAVLVAAKSDESYVLNGTSFDNFTPALLDPRYGVVSPRAFQNVGGILYGWSSDGARRFTALETQPIAQPLELISPLPNDFPALGPARLCFSSYDLARYRLTWVFPDSVNAAVPVPAFTLSLWKPQDPRWSFDEIQQPVCCAGLIVGRDAGTPLPPPLGFVSSPTADDTTIAADPRYRSVTLQWTNNAQTGTEVVQIFARPAGGTWAVVRSVAVIAAAEQSTSWDLARPVTAYDLAFRYMNGTLPGVGYEGGDPDAWTAPTAAGAKTTVSTTSAPVAWASGIAFTGPSVPIPLAWLSGQQFGCYLLEKSLNAGATWADVAVDLVADGYAYTIPAGELGTTVRFRLTAQRGAVVGPTAGTLDVYMGIVVGQPTGVAVSFVPAVNGGTVSWTAATNATSYLVEFQPQGGGWSTAAVVSGLSYDWVARQADVNTTVSFRVTGYNGAIHGTVSATATAAATYPVPTISSITVAGDAPHTTTAAWTPDGVADGARLIQMDWAFWKGAVLETAFGTTFVPPATASVVGGIYYPLPYTIKVTPSYWFQAPPVGGFYLTPAVQVYGTEFDQVIS